MLPVPSPAVRQAPSKVFQLLVSLAWVKSSFDVTWADALQENPAAIAPARITIEIELYLCFMDHPETGFPTGSHITERSLREPDGSHCASVECDLVRRIVWFMVSRLRRASALQTSAARRSAPRVVRSEICLATLDPRQALGDLCGALNIALAYHGPGCARKRSSCCRRRAVRYRIGGTAQGLRQDVGIAAGLCDEGRARSIREGSRRIGVRGVLEEAPGGAAERTPGGQVDGDGIAGVVRNR